MPPVWLNTPARFTPTYSTEGASKPEPPRLYVLVVERFDPTSTAAVAVFVPPDWLKTPLPAAPMSSRKARRDRIR